MTCKIGRRPSPGRVGPSLVTTALLLSCFLAVGAKAETVPNEWSVAQAGAEAGRFCRFSWDSGTGRTVEFDLGPRTEAWIVTDAGWERPQGSLGSVEVIAGRVHRHIAEKSISATGVLLAGDPEDAGIVREIVNAALRGTGDIDIRFESSNTPWIVPISRIYPLHAEFSNCLRSLSQASDHSDDSSDGISPF